MQASLHMLLLQAAPPLRLCVDYYYYLGYVWQALNAHLLGELLALGQRQLRDWDFDSCGSWHGPGCLQGSERCRREQKRVGQSVISICRVAKERQLLLAMPGYAS
jgi:hypothetical protein